MNNISFDGNTAWFVAPTNRYGSSRVSVQDITTKNFSFLARVSVDWDKMIPGTNTQQGGVIMKNGRHSGISVSKHPGGWKFISATIWVENPIEGESSQRVFDIHLNTETMTNTDIFEIGMTVDIETKIISLYCNDTLHSVTYEGEIIDYSNSWLWVGCGNILDSCAPEFKTLFHGEISYAGIYSKALKKKEIDEIFNDTTNTISKYQPVCAFDFDLKTPYKSFDITDNGNHLVKFDEQWMSLY